MIIDQHRESVNRVNVTFLNARAAEAFHAELAGRVEADLFQVTIEGTRVSFLHTGTLHLGSELAKDFEARWIARLQAEKDS